VSGIAVAAPAGAQGGQRFLQLQEQISAFPRFQAAIGAPPV
jgi:hypothetical protein